MSSVFFGNAARIIKQVFDWLQTSDQTKTSNLIVDTFQSGIDNATIAGEGFTLVPGTSTLSVTVQGQGIAYDSVSNRIFLASSDTTAYNPANVIATTNDGLGNFILTPQSSGCVNIPLTGGSFNYLWIDYLATTDTSAFTLNAETNAKIFFKLTDGYNIQVTTTNVAPDSNSVFLGTVDLTSIFSGIIPSSVISQIGRQYFNILPNIVPIITPQANRSDATTIYNPASTYTLESHIKAVGTSPTGVSPTNPHAMTLADLGISSLDTVMGHRQLEHGVGGGLAAANAIIAGVPGTPFPTTSGMSASINIVNPGSDYLTIHQLLSSEFALINGTAYNVTDIFGAIPINANVFFPNASGTYNVYYDSVVKAFSLTTADISSDVTKLWLCSAVYTFVGTGPSDHNSLSSLVDYRRVGSSTHLLQRWLTSGRPGSGSTAASSGEFGFNLTTNLLEYWDGTAWRQPLPESGGTMSGVLNMGSNKITNLANGTASSDAAAFGQIPARMAPTIQKFLSGSGTYFAPAGALYLRVVAVGGGGGGSGSGNDASGSAGGSGGTTTFGSSLLIANGGFGGTYSPTTTGNVGGSGGSASLGTAIGLAFTGNSGTGSQKGSVATFNNGGAGGYSLFPGAGSSATNSAGESGIANTGGGGQGGCSGSSIQVTGAGGGSGGWVDAVISSPSFSYSYSIGSGGSGGTAGSTGFAGGSGGSGIIIVTEYYN